MARGWRSVVVALGVVPALLSCGAPLACTAIGCVSQVSVDLSGAAATYGPEPATARLCVEGTCEDSPVSFSGGQATGWVVKQLPSVTASPQDPRVDVTFTLSRGGTVLVRATTTTTLEKLAPNGERCGPVCWSSQLRLVGGRLVPLPTSSPSPG